MKNLFGELVADKELPGPIIKAKRKPTQPSGYAAPPGTGPKGETCKTCKFYARIHRSGTYRKCLKVAKLWTCGPGTDILARSPACHYFEKPTTIPS